MESAYDRKFEEMKKYIPFLESMIKRLESTSTSKTNPRQAQLDKIRSLRDLLMDKKKRMKMENLLKCEQVLVNLYAKVERDSLPGIQRDTLPGIKKATEPLFSADTSNKTNKPDLDTARNKLKTITKISTEIDPNSLPEIAPAGETEGICTPGSKEPALFQRRPNKNSLSPSRGPSGKESSEKKSPHKTVTKRNYTRVLVSPEPSSRRWTTSEDPPSDKPLYSRRSPRRSPKPLEKKDKKKSSRTAKPKGLNITLNVPEESLDSLNSSDILSRIIKCSDNDVDIDTLRDLRKQILGELKQTGKSEDISDLILKSYKSKKSTNKRKDEVEEGELSDSESEAIESIYGSLVVVDKDKKQVISSDKDKQSRKIQISLVINSDKEEVAVKSNKANAEVTDFEMFDIEEKHQSVDNTSKKETETVKKTGNSDCKTNTAINKNADNLLTINVEDDDERRNTNNKECKDSDSSYIDISSSDTETTLPGYNKSQGKNENFKPNYYSPLNENKETVRNDPNEKQLQEDANDELKSQSEKPQEINTPPKDSTTKLEEVVTSPNTVKSTGEIKSTSSFSEAHLNLPSNSDTVSTEVNITYEKPKHDVEIPLLNKNAAVPTPEKKDTVSELEILQALKNEILSETIAIPGSDATTPLLHQPKITKVSCTQEVMAKKRISIEKYKEKSVTAPKARLFLNNPKQSKSNENSKKSSLKLTKEEQQRFNFLPLGLDDSSDEDNTNNSLDDIYGNLAPESPENNDKVTSVSSSPIIIPVEPVKSMVSAKADVDMRTMAPLLSPKPVSLPPGPSSIIAQLISGTLPVAKTDKRDEKLAETRRAPLDPRVRRDINKQLSKDSPNPHGATPRNTANFSDVAPYSTPVMTPSRQQFDFDDNSSRKHVYAAFPSYEPSYEPSEKSVNRDVQSSRWEPNSETMPDDCNSRWDLGIGDTGQLTKWDDRDKRCRSTRDGPDYHKSRYDSDRYKTGSKTDAYRHEQKDDFSYSRTDCPRTPVHPFGRSDVPTTPTPSFGRVDGPNRPTTPNHPFGMSDCPTTPIHPFGRADCPTTPIHPFGRNESQLNPNHPFSRSDATFTPSHAFARSEAPMTPSHPFGRSEAPMTPNHAFGRSEAPMTPSHPFGRSEAPMTPNHAFGRSEAPMTPSHPFGRSEAPMTPNHAFGRSEAPMTPSHSFGRIDMPMTPSHPFGRSEFQQNSGPKAVKDPRLNRNDSSSRKFHDDRERGYYNDRRTSDRSDSYRNNRERSERSKYERTGCHNREHTPGREMNIGGNLSRDYEIDRLYSRDRSGGRPNDFRRDLGTEHRNYREVGSRREYQRSQNEGRSGPVEERFQRASSRGPTNDTLTYNKPRFENTLSVKPQSGRSFTIDTSVNSTFQESINRKGLQIFENSFQCRRGRAASVGRTLTRESSIGRNFRESSVGRTLPKHLYSTAEDTSGYKKMVHFVRARSMGRDLVDQSAKSFKEIKADLKAYKVNYTEKSVNKTALPLLKSNYCDPRSRKEVYERQSEKKTSPKTSNKKTVYSPRKNCRDPRMQRDQSSDRNRYEDKKKTFGIVYSSDNIARGTILGSGYGVKNYKIPKLKKPVETQIDPKESSDLKHKKVEKDVKDNNLSTKSKSKINKKVDEVPSDVKVDVKKAKGAGTTAKDRHIEKKNKDSKPKKLHKPKLCDSAESDEETVAKTKKAKKSIINSDSETESPANKNDISQTSLEIEVPRATIDNVDAKTTINSKFVQKSVENNSNEISSISSFGIDDLEIFPEHMSSDPVLDNINALIADLDNDIDTTKAPDFSKEMSLDNMFDSINSPEANMEESLQDITEVIKNTIKSQEESSNRKTSAQKTAMEIIDHSSKITSDNDEKTGSQGSEKILEHAENEQGSEETKEHSGNEDINNSSFQIDTVKSTESNLQEIKKSIQDNQTETKVVKQDNEAIVSTTNEEKIPSTNQDDISEDRPSTPDSTFDASAVILNKSPQDGLPDSTNEKTEMHPDVSSTRDQSVLSTKDPENSSQKDNAEIILSLLQDKSKIKEVLDMLGDKQSDKIRQCFEKLSELVLQNTDDTKDDRTEKVDEDQLTVDNESKETESNVIVTTQDCLDKKTDVDAEAGSVTSFEVECKDSFEGKSEVPVEVQSEISANESKVNQLEKSDTSDSNDTEKKGKKTVKKARVKKTKKVSLKRKKKGKWKSDTKSSTNLPIKKPKKRSSLDGVSRELKQLQESIKEMFVKENTLNITGIRMCRLAKLVDEKNSNQQEEKKLPIAEPKVVLEKFKEETCTDKKEDLTEPKVVLEKCKKDADKKEITKVKADRKKPGPKPKVKQINEEDNIDSKHKDDKITTAPKYKPGPKSKTKKLEAELDSVSFDDSVSEATTAQTSERENESDTEDDSLASSKSFGSSEALAELKKKPKRKRGAWQSGIIKKRRKKNEPKPAEHSSNENLPLPNKEINKDDKNCYIDKSYCFLKNVSEYACKMCEYKGPEIVKHYKTEHPHTEIPLSRMSPSVAREAVEQCEDVNFQAISKMPTERYICRFCFNDFGNKKNVLEEFFWHVVSMHTGEYKSLCSECVNVTRCPFNLDIPPPPKELKGQLIGYICGKCNFTQVSLENLKTHVIVRHNDELTAVFTINLAVMSKRTMKSLMKRNNIKEQARVLRSSRSNPIENETEPKNTTNEKLSKVPVHAKITFENDDTEVKLEKQDNENYNEIERTRDNTDATEPDTLTLSETDHGPPSSDIMDTSHFKVAIANSGIKEYVCCINGKENHYKTNLLISMKRHVQTKHNEIWDGYCSVCKVIVMPQGEHSFKECLQHMLDNHMDNFPIFKETSEFSQRKPNPTQELPKAVEKTVSPKPVINVRALADLLTDDVAPKKTPEVLPKIKSVISLGVTADEPNRSPQRTTETIAQAHTIPMFKSPLSVEKVVPKPEEPYKYEEMQAEVMATKHLVVLESMSTEEKLVQIFKCAGRFCCFTTDSADAALLHASTHQRLGGENALLCSYCDFDCKGNAIDLVMHVFKMHGRCPFVCGRCFYRAIASQLVVAHMQRIHGDVEGKVLETETVTPVDNSADVLPREVAVQHYTCVDRHKTCTYKTYTAGKFVAHLAGNHTPPFMCHICSLEESKPKELIDHLKIHGLKLYQCTWCVEGGDNEEDFLAHSSARHPSRQPQAYLRVITNNTNKDGASKTMVLPLAKLNKSNVPTHLITTRDYVADPAREAEKAIEMEKLITAMPFLTTEDTNNRVQTPVQKVSGQLSPQIPEVNTTPVTMDVNTEEPSLVEPPTPPTTSALEINQAHQLPPLLKPKAEPIDGTHNKISNPTIICLDSDEDDPSDSREEQNVIDLSDEDRLSNSDTVTLKKLGALELFKCQSCQVIFKYLSVFKRHLNSCFAGKSHFLCAHCTFIAPDLDKICYHYNFAHSDPELQKPVYVCGECNRTDHSVNVIKNHVKKDHGLRNISVSSKPEQDEPQQYVVTGTTRGRPGPKRKLLGSVVSESSPKRMRYGAQDLHKLPQKPILDDFAYCSECEFSTKVRLNLVRHIQQHADSQLVPQTAPVNPVPHLETNEKHFDRMVNLASSSLELARVEKPTSVSFHIPPEVASQYPKYVPDRQRHTCGAKDCSYISVDEAMLKCHWDTLHAGSNDFHCVHCPPYQHLDTSKPLTASRIIMHLKMHDVRLYACSSCSYYHYRKQVLEKHISEVHKGLGNVTIVREESTNSSPVTSPQITNTAPTMDLKPWKCGLCAFKSMLRPEVVDHCAKNHNTKMQYKCPACPFRGSSLENVTRHQGNSHPGNSDDVFYYYYREGSIPDESDGTPRWVKQRQKLVNVDTGPEVKTEHVSAQVADVEPLQTILPKTPTVNLNLVKEEILDPDVEEPSRRFGEIGDPCGLKYKCPLCKQVTEDSKEAMQSHLYEELKYRKWACSVCAYKAFHKKGLNEHMLIEHRQQRTIEPIELPEDTRVERWVCKVLDHQASLIETNRENLEKQKMQAEKPSTSISISQNTSEKPPYNDTDVHDEEKTDNLIQAFGEFGAPSNVNYSCPKCDYLTVAEGAMKDHLETELNKIRWRCNGCWQNSQNYHEAQLHSKTCKNSRPGKTSRPVEAIRDPSVRAAWVAAVIRTQKQGMSRAHEQEQLRETDDVITGPLENSLLVVRYEEKVPTPEEEMINRRKRPAPSAPVASTSASAVASPDSDDERLVIDEPSNKNDDSETPKKPAVKKCTICNFTTKYQASLDQHVLRHYNLRPLTCDHCGLTLYCSSKESHNNNTHPNLPPSYSKTKTPSGPPITLETMRNKRSKRNSSSLEDEGKPPHPPQSKEEAKKDDESKLICLVCEKAVPESEIEAHAGTHDKKTYFSKKGEVVVKCCICLSLFPTIDAMQEHNDVSHPTVPVNYAYFKLNHHNREILKCGHCGKRFKFFRDLKSHHNLVHSALQLKYESRPYYPGAYDYECETERRESSK